MIGRRPFHRTCPDAFTLIELLVVIAVIGLLISILLPALSKARQTAMNAACRTHVREQLMAAQLYASENEDYLPAGKNYDWEKYTYPILTYADYIQDAMIPYVGGVRGEDASVDVVLNFSEVFRCPAVEQNPKFDWLNEPETNHYRYNTHKAVVHDTGLGREIGSVRDPSNAVLTYDVAFPDWYPTDFPHDVVTRSINVGYVDGHVGSASADKYFETSPNVDYAEEADNPFVKLGWD